MKKDSKDLLPGTQIFDHEKFGSVRIADENGEPWLYARDVALALGYERPSEAIRRHCLRAKQLTISVPLNQGGVVRPKIIPESDLYLLVMGSKLLSALEFKKWVVEKVLPSIRKTGSYSIVSDEDEVMIALRSAIANREKILRMEKDSEELKLRIQNQEKRAQEVEARIEHLSNQSYKPRDLDFSNGERSFTMIAIESGWFTKSGNAHGNAVKRVCEVERIHELEGFTIDYDHKYHPKHPAVRCKGLSARGVQYWKEVVDPKFASGEFMISKDDLGSGKTWHVIKKPRKHLK